MDATERPRFSSLVIAMDNLLEKDSGYLELSLESSDPHLSRPLNLKKKDAPSKSFELCSMPTVQESEVQKQEVIN